MTPGNPFTDPGTTRALYRSTDRLRRRSSALYAAKVSGPGAVSTIADLAEAVAPRRATVLDIGCGAGETTSRLAERLTPRGLVAVDQSPGLLATARQRATSATTVCADFHHLPLASATVDLVVAAFCVYHSPQPEQVLVEVARCLASRGAAILATKSADSYAEIDQLLSTSGLDADATRHPSLYSTFHTDNAADIASRALRVVQVVCQHHVFRFADLDHLAAYAATSPKYRLAPDLASNPTTLAAALRARVPNQPLTTTSTVTYIVGTKP